MNTIEVLEAARALITHPARWTQCTSARDKLGVATQAMAGDAVCWCSIGAINRAAYGSSHRVNAAVEALRDQLGADGYPRGIVTFNDAKSHTAVLALFDNTITRLKGEQQ